MYKLSEDIKTAYELMEVPLLIFSGEDENLIPLLVSNGFYRLFGHDRKTLTENFAEVIFYRVHPDEKAKLRHVSIEFLKHNCNYDLIFRARVNDTYHPIHAVGVWQKMPDGGEVAIITYTDMDNHETEMSELVEKYRFFQKDSFYTDTLTGLQNINYMHRFAVERIDRIRDKGDTPVIMYYDLDSMQSYNTRYGFSRGDELLLLVSNILQDIFPYALVTRGADDHFIILDGMPPVDMEELGRNPRDILSAKIDEANTRVREEAYGTTTGIHCGICVFDINTSIIEGLDHAKMAAKELGEDLNICYKFYTPEDNSVYLKERYIVENFDSAIKNDWFKVYYQALQRLESNKGFGFEALARWNDPERGLLPPAYFIPVLEKYHLLHIMDLHMFEKVCQELKVRYDTGLPLLPVSINFAGQDFDYVDVADELDRIVKKYNIEQYGIDRTYFVVEITEQDMATATKHFYDQIKQIRSYGFRLWIDDFGSGYSSLNVFSKFDADLIKFDMDLLRNLDANNGVNREVLKSMFSLAKKLKIHTLCEGMETEEQRQFLLENGCELGQGYLYHKPEPLDSILKRLNEGIPIPEWERREERMEYRRRWNESK